MSGSRIVSVLCVGVAVVAGAGFVVQRELTGALRAERSLLRDQRAELQRLQSENRRLLAVQPAAAELERLRSDHAALARLRREIEELKARAAEMDRGQAGGRGKG